MLVMLVVLMMLMVLMMMLVYILHRDLDSVVLSDRLDLSVTEGHALHQTGLEEGEDGQPVELSAPAAATLRLSSPGSSCNISEI